VCRATACYCRNTHDETARIKEPDCMSGLHKNEASTAERDKMDQRETLGGGGDMYARNLWSPGTRIVFYWGGVRAEGP